METKPLLVIETSGAICGAAIFFNDDKYYEINIREKHSHSEKLFESIDSLFRLAGIGLKECEAIGVSSGPGSFTGLRIGMSAAKGLAIGSGLPVIPIPTFEALALQISQIKNDNDNFIIANKVNVDELYYAKFQVKGNSYIFVENLQIIEADELEKLCGETPVYGTAAVDENRFISAPDALFVAKWGKRFGNELMQRDYDYLEPNYLKNFIIKERKNG